MNSLHNSNVIANGHRLDALNAIDDEPNLIDCSFADAVVHGLSIKPKRIGSKWLYDRKGAILFEKIVSSPNYYIPRAEASILRTHSAEIADFLGPNGSLLELGSGSSTKVRILLDAMESLRFYLPVEISEAQLLEACQALRRDYPAISIYPVAADYMKEFELPRLARNGKLMAFFPGSTLSNLLPQNSVRFMSRMNAILGPGSMFLIGVDLKKDEASLIRAYNDAYGAIWHFNLNILERINTELGCAFQIEKFRHQAIYNREAGRIESAIYSTEDQEIVVAGESFELARGERIVLEYSHKYDLDEFQALAVDAGWVPREAWVDRDELFSVHLLSN